MLNGLVNNFFIHEEYHSFVKMLRLVAECLLPFFFSMGQGSKTDRANFTYLPVAVGLYQSGISHGSVVNCGCLI